MTSSAPSSGLRILLVDDDADITSTLKRGLEVLGIKVDAFNRPSDALERDARKYDLAVIDIHMPEINGFKLARELWNQNGDLRVCFLSAFDIIPSEARSMLPSLKSHCFLTKPMNASSLAAHIQSHFIAQ
jgi:DNA-binding response OmpR family regulator